MTYQFLPIFKSNIGQTSKHVYLYLERHGARNGKCFHSTKTIANNTNLSQRTVFRSLKELEGEGWILITRRYRANGGKTSNQYDILK